MMQVRVNVMEHAVGYDQQPLSYAKPGDAGVDLRAAVPEALYIEPRGRRLVPTGIKIEMPPIGAQFPEWMTMEAQVRPRSGLAMKHGLGVANAPGTIDYGYRGEICVILENRGESAYLVTPGERVAQLVFAMAICPEFVVADALSETERGEAGFGSTGTA